jgi:hypothetical protein
MLFKRSAPYVRGERFSEYNSEGKMDILLPEPTCHTSQTVQI